MLRLIVIFVGVLLTNQSHADWQLLPGSASFTIGTTKNGTITEIHRFRKLEGFVQSDGTAVVTVNLLSVDTGIEIRDQRMQAMLFSITANAVYKTKLDIEMFQKMGIGQSKEFRMDGMLELGGRQAPVPLTTRITRQESGNYQVTTISANEIDVGMFGFSDGIEQLRAIANLQLISPIVTFEFNLEFAPIEARKHHH